MTEVVALTVRVPKWRFRLGYAVIWTLAPILPLSVGERMADRLASWMAKGVRVE